MEIDHEMISKVILPLPLIHEGQMSAKVCAKIQVNCLED